MIAGALQPVCRERFRRYRRMFEVAERRREERQQAARRLHEQLIVDCMSAAPSWFPADGSSRTEARGPEFWELLRRDRGNRVLQVERPDFEVYLALGLVLAHGRLLRIDSRAGEELTAEARRIGGRILLRNQQPFVYRGHDGEPRAAGTGRCVLFFECDHWLERRRFYRFEHAVLHYWAPRLRSCLDWLVYLQRRVRAWLRARRALPVAMALHGRLGRGSAVAGLGEDLLCKILESV